MQAKFNRFGVRVTVGHTVEYQTVRGGKETGRIVRMAHEQGRGIVVKLETGNTCGIDDVTKSLNKLTAYRQTKTPAQGGGYCAYLTTELDVKETDDKPYKGRTASGYGRALPTHYMIRERIAGAPWQRVKCVCFSNSGTLYTGRLYSECDTIRIDRAD